MMLSCTANGQAVIRVNKNQVASGYLVQSLPNISTYYRTWDTANFLNPGQVRIYRVIH